MLLKTQCRVNSASKTWIESSGRKRRTSLEIAALSGANAKQTSDRVRNIPYCSALVVEVVSDILVAVGYCCEKKSEIVSQPKFENLFEKNCSRSFPPTRQSLDPTTHHPGIQPIYLQDLKEGAVCARWVSFKIIQDNI
jgi:hypothetical protein